MAKNSIIKKIAAAMVVVVAMFGCQKIEVEHPTPNIAMGAERLVQPGDTLIGVDYMDARERFVPNGIECSLTIVDIWKTAGRKPREKRASHVVPFSHIGIDPQYLDNYRDTTINTTKDKTTPTEKVTSQFGEWTVTNAGEEQIYKAENALKNVFGHMTTTSGAMAIYTHPSEGNIQGFTVEFPMPSWTLGMNQLPITEVSGVVHNGKTWNAFKYECEIPATFEIAHDYVVSGEEATKTITVSNIAFLLKHEVDTQIKDINYVGKFYTKGSLLDTEEEAVSGKLVTTDNGEVIESIPFELAMRLSEELSQVGDVRVNSEEELKDATFSVEKGEISESPMAKDVFTGKQYTGKNSIKLADHTISDIYGWSCWNWGDVVLPSAEIVSREVIVTSEKNETLSSTSILVYTVTVKVIVKVAFVNVNRAAEEYEVSVSYNRYWQLPDDYTTDFEQKDFVLELKNDGANKLMASDEHNTVVKIVKNRGEEISRSEARYPLDLYFTAEGGDTTKVSYPHKPKVLAIEEHPNTSEWCKKADEYGFDKRWVKGGHTIRIEGGNAVECEKYYEVQGKNEKDIYDHAEINSVRASDVSFSEPVLVDSVRTENTVKKVYRIDVSLVPNVTSTKVETKASGNVNTLSVTTPIYQMVIEGDEYIEGKDETEFWSEINPNGGIDVCGRLYEYYTLSGKVLVDERRENMLPTLVGVNGNEVFVANADGYVLTGNGLNQTGSGVYTNYATKGSDRFAYDFNYNAPAEKVLNLNGRSGKGASKTFAASFKIEDINLTTGATYVDGNYNVFPKTSNVKGTYTVENKSVVLAANATRNFKVEQPKDTFVSDRIVKTVTKNGNTFNWNVKLYETFSLSGEKLKDEKSGTITPSLSGSEGGEIVVSDVNFTTTGNGVSTTGSGTYTDNAGNGNQSFSNSYSYNAPASVNVQLNGTNGIKYETVSTSWSLVEAGQNIGSASAVSGYNVYPYTNTVKGTYTVENQSTTLTANATKSLKVQIPDTFVSDRIVKTVTKSGNTFNWNVKLYETFSLSGEKLKDEKSGTITPSLSGSEGGEIVVSDINFTTTGNGISTTGSGTYTDNASNGSDSFSNSYSYNAPASVNVQLNGTNGIKYETVSTSWSLVEAGQNVGSASAVSGYNVYPYTNTVKGTYTVENQSVELTATATKSLKVQIPDTFVSDRIVKTVTKNGNTFNWNVKLYETFSLSGEKLKDEKSGTITPSLSGSEGGEIVVSDVNFTTTGNGISTTGSGTYTDNASNGSDSFSNSYSYDAPASVNVQLNGTNGIKYETVSTSWSLVEAGQNIGSASAVSGYNVYPYTNTVKGTYTVENQSVELTATATKSLKVERNVPKIIPDDWGKIIAAGFSAVPSHLVSEGVYADGNGAQTATSCMTIVTDKGAVPVLFGWADQDPRIPTTSQILASPFTAGNYTADYNSAYYTNNGWVPAIAADAGSGISYAPLSGSTRFIRNESLVMWGWRGGNYSTVLPGYTCSVSNGVLTVMYNGQVVLEIQ